MTSSRTQSKKSKNRSWNPQEKLHQILTDESDQCIQSLLSLVSSAMGTEHAAMTLLNPRTNQITVRSQNGFIETSAEDSFCGYALSTGETLIVQNSLEDQRFARSPFTTGPAQIKFYAGTPLHITGFDIKMTVCSFDSSPRKFTEKDHTILAELATTAQEVIRLELLKAEAELEREKVQLDFHSLVHDLKTPFSGLLNLSEELALLTDQVPNKRLLEIANLLLTSSYAALNVVQDNENEYIQQHEFPPHHTPLHEIVTEVAALYGPLENAKGIKIAQRFSKSIEISEHEDIWKLALRNLISNSLKHSYANSEITIEAYESGPFLEVHVRDSGAGMNDETLEALEKGNPDRLTHLGTEFEEGFGHGIQICTQKLKDCNGSLKFESCPGIGTVAIISIPRFK